MRYRGIGPMENFGFVENSRMRIEKKGKKKYENNIFAPFVNYYQSFCPTLFLPRNYFAFEIALKSLPEECKK